MVKRCRDVRDLKKLGEILQFPQDQGNGEDGTELRLAGLFEAFDRAFRHANALGKFLLRDVLPDTQLAHPFGALAHHVLRDHQQKELAERVGVAEGTIKRFEKTGEAQFRTVLTIALVLRRLEDFTDLFKIPDVPASLYHPEPKKPRQRARKK